MPWQQQPWHHAMPPQHKVIYAGSAKSGGDVWHCPECGHRLLTRWRPHFECEVLTEGDSRAVHAGNLCAAPSGQALRGPAASLDDTERSWLRDNGIDWDSRDTD